MPRVNGVPVRDIVRMTKIVMTRYFDMPINTDPDKTGGYLALYDVTVPKMFFIIEVCECNRLTAGYCFQYVQEKIERLFSKRSLGHFSSWQSRDNMCKKFGGAITTPEESKADPRGRTIIGGLSGLKQESEEAILLVVWMYFGWLDIEDAKKIIDISNNEIFLPLLAECYDLF